MVLNIEQKVSIIKKIDQGAAGADNTVCWEYSIGKTTLVDILKVRDNLFKVYSATETNMFLIKQNTISKPRQMKFDECL